MENRNFPARENRADRRGVAYSLRFLLFFFIYSLKIFIFPAVIHHILIYNYTDYLYFGIVCYERDH